MLTRAELKSKKASDFKEGDLVFVSKYIIHIEYGPYPKPLQSWVETTDGKILDSTPGVQGGWPYYIDAFISS